METDITLRNALKSDTRFIYNLRFSDDCIKVSTTSNKPTYNQHCIYFNEHIDEYKVIMVNGKMSIGYIRTNKDNEISIALIKEYRNKGIGSLVLKKINGTATIKKDNLQSINAFEKAGFKLKYYIYEKSKTKNRKI